MHGDLVLQLLIMGSISLLLIKTNPQINFPLPLYHKSPLGSYCKKKKLNEHYFFLVWKIPVCRICIFSVFWSRVCKYGRVSTFIVGALWWVFPRNLWNLCIKLKKIRVKVTKATLYGLFFFGMQPWQYYPDALFLWGKKHQNPTQPLPSAKILPLQEKL